MKLFGMRVHVVLIIVLVTTTLLIGANYLYQKYRVDDSLLRSLEASEYVLSVTLDRGAEQTVVTVALSDVPDLQEAHASLSKLTATLVDPAQFNLEVEDRRNARLVEAYETIHLHVMEAASTGQFSVLEGRAEALATEYGFTRARILVDEGYVYIQLHDSEEYLYEVVPRLDVQVKGESTT